MSFYLTSAEPEVIAIVAQNVAGFPAFREKAFVWAQERGTDSYFMGTFGRRTTVTGLMGQPVGDFGRWTKPDSRGRSLPFKNNTVEYALLKGLRFDRDLVPGLPEAVYSVANPDGTSYVMYPEPFVVGGVAWVSYSNHPDVGEMAKFGPQWVECLASAFHRAREQYREAQGA